MNKSAVFSDNKAHRLWLERYWSCGPVAMVIGLNPSTADDQNDDPTIKSICRILDSNKFGGLIMVNLFTYITPYPEKLSNPASCDYDLKQCLKIWKTKFIESDAVVFAWGNFDTHGRAEKAIAEFGAFAYCVGLNKNGSPKHPLYIKSNSELIKFRK